MKKQLLLIASIVSAPLAFGQGVGINTSGANPDANTILDATSQGTTSTFYGLKVKNSAGVDQMVVRSDGRVGIMTAAPDYELDVEGNIGGNEYYYHNGDANTYMRFTTDRIRFRAGNEDLLDLVEGATDEVVVNNTAGNDVDFRVETTGFTNMFLVDAGNNRVSVGSANTDATTGAEFNVTGNSTFSDDIRLRDGGTAAGDYLIRLYDSSDDGVIDIFRNTAVDVRIHANDNSFYNPNASVNRVFMIGHNTPFYGTLDMLEVNCTGANLYSVNGYTTSTGVSVYGENLASGYAVYGQGNGAANWAGYFAGDLNVTGTYYNISDQRLKTNIQEFNGAMDKLNELKVYTYNFKEGYNGLNSEKTTYGFMAQELMQTFPTLVAEKTLRPTKAEIAEGAQDEQILAVSYMELIPVLVEGLQEEDAKVQELENEIEELNKKIAELEALITNK